MSILINDCEGGSIFVHAFGAYFGMAITVVMSRKNYDKAGSEKNDTTVTSDIFSLLGETENVILFWIILSFSTEIILRNN